MEKARRSKINKTKIIVILGPTATGKSALAVKLARTLDGEVISADSRQVYKGLDIGAGKITPAEMKGVPHHMLDVASPKKTYTVAEFQTAGQKIIKEISNRGRVPIICGGSGFYIQALVDSVIFPDVPPNPLLRAQLEKKSVAELCKILKKLDPRRFAEIDQANPRRLVRAIEIAKALGKVPTLKKLKKTADKDSLYDPLFIGFNLPSEELKKKIHKRLISRLKDGMVAEVRNLHKSGLTWKRLESFGLEYRAIAQFLQKKISEKEMITGLETAIWHFAKRQMVWFKRDDRIRWFTPKDTVSINRTARRFLK